MSLTCGFYNSINDDRKYDAVQMSSIFDGIIFDGIYMSVGDHFNVTAGDNMLIYIGTGRAWFNHTWTLNDSVLTLIVPRSEILYDRIDAVVLEVNSTENVRENSIKIVSGIPSTNPEQPELTNTNLIHQYPLAYIYVSAETTSIRQSNIVNMIGTSDTPFVTGPNQGMNIDTLIAQWKDQWDEFFENETGEMNETKELWTATWNEWFNEYTTTNSEYFQNWRDIEQAKWIAWFANVQNQLSEDQAGHLLIQIENTNERIDQIIKPVILTKEEYDSLSDEEKNRTDVIYYYY